MSSRLPKQLQKLQDQTLVKALEAGLDLVEAELEVAVASHNALIDSAARHLLEAGGKRVRPVLVLLTAQLGDPKRPEVIDAAVIAELTHLATLYHDDVMDDAPTRRGVPTTQKVYGNSVAILTGDLLLARASQIGVGLGSDSLRMQAETFERLCLGQLHETIGPQDGEDPIQHYLQVLADKTGSLIASSAAMGAIHSGARVEYHQALINYGERVGVAFQLIDDVIDISEKGPSGKTPGTDLRAGVDTLPTLLLRKAAADGDQSAVELVALIDSDLSDDAVLAEAVSRLRSHPVAAEAQRQAESWAQAAIDALDPLPEGSVKRALIQFADAVVNRDN